MTLQEAIARRRSCRSFASRPVPLAAARQLIEAAQGVTDASGRRAAPSAHAFYPLRLRLVAGRVEGLPAGVHAVGQDDRSLTAVVGEDRRAALQAAALEQQPWIGGCAGILAFAADPEAAGRRFAEQPPVGERGGRYLWIEAGAAAQNVLLAATAAGLGAVLVAGFDDRATAQALGLESPLVPLLLLCFGWPAEA